MLKRSISLILVVLVLITSLISCARFNEQENATGTQNGTVVTDGNGDANYDIGDDLGTRDYGGKDITIGHCGHAQYKGEISQDRLTGDVVQDSIYKRNITVGERLNIVIKNET